MNSKQIPILVFQFLDLETSVDKKNELQDLLVQAANGEVTLVPICMEGINTIYYRDKVIKSEDLTGSYAGRVYTGQVDDLRAIRAFIDSTFNWVKPVLSGREKIVVRYTNFYKNEAKRFHMLIEGQELKSELIFTNQF